LAKSDQSCGVAPLPCRAARAFEQPDVKLALIAECAGVGRFGGVFGQWFGGFAPVGQDAGFTVKLPVFQAVVGGGRKYGGRFQTASAACMRMAAPVCLQRTRSPNLSCCGCCVMGCS